MSLNDTFTSTGAKFFHHQETMTKLRNGKGQPVVTHVMLTDVCQHTCAFCSVQKRAGDSLVFDDVLEYISILQRYGLKAVILSGGGNPILYKCKETGTNFNDVVDALHMRGLEIGLITNGMPLRKYEGKWHQDRKHYTIRESWGTVRPDTLDKLTWVRISMAGLDHNEHEVFVPDIDPTKTTLGFSYVAHDIYQEPNDPHHGKVSRRLDLLSGDTSRASDQPFEDRRTELIRAFSMYGILYKPRYIRLLPNCLEPEKIAHRCKQLKDVADVVNRAQGYEVAFVQYKPPKAPHACYLGYVHPVLNCDGWVYPCDSCVLNEAAGHQFANPWRICRWDEVASVYEAPVRSLIADPARTCPGCVFHESNELLKQVVDGTIELGIPQGMPTHVNFV